MYILFYYSTYELIYVHIHWTKTGKIYIEGILIEYSTFLYDGRFSFCEQLVMGLLV